jgi:predicted phosphodiesterase
LTAIVFGHSHKPLIERRGGVLFVNPGSAGPRRFKLPVTVATLALRSGRRCKAKIVPLSV